MKVTLKVDSLENEQKRIVLVETVGYFQVEHGN